MGQKITVTKALCSLRGTGVASFLSGCSAMFHYPPLPMWKECVAGLSESPTGISAPGRINYFPTVHPPKQKEKRTREDRMIRAIDLFNRLSFVERCGLWLFSHVDVEDTNLVWCLIQTSKSGARPGFNYRDAAAYRARIAIGGANWKDPQAQVVIEQQATARKAAEQQLRECWEGWVPRLSETLQVSRQNNPLLYRSYENLCFYHLPTTPHPNPQPSAVSRDLRRMLSEIG